MSKRIFLCRLSQETNAFNPVLSKLSDFYRVEGARVLDDPRRAGDTVRGMIDVLSESGGVEILAGPCYAMRSAGNMANEVPARFLEETVRAIRAALPLDGVLISFHGASQSESSFDVCGDVAEEIRKAVGEEAVLSASFDLHANITEKLMKNVDFISGYRTYPHLDIYDVGKRAAEKLLMRLDGKPLCTVRAAIPVIASAHAYTTSSGLLGELMTYADGLINAGRIADYGVFQVQPWLDTPDMRSTVIVTASDEETAKTVAEDLIQKEFALRQDLQGGRLASIGEVVEKAKTNTSGRPVVLADSADSPNAGATGDSAAVIECLLPVCGELSAAAAVTDPKAAEKAFSLGVGGTADFMLGATIAPALSKPVCVKNARVVSLHEGLFTMAGPQEKGSVRNVGRTAVLAVGKLRILVSENGSAEGDLNFYRAFGIDPASVAFVAVKACTSFRAGYASIAQEIVNADTPGAAAPVLTRLAYQNRPKPLYPFEEITRADITPPERFR